MKLPTFLLFAALIALLPVPRVMGKGSDHHQPSVAVVSTTRDSGRGSLRAAIESANRNAGTRIIFQIPASDAGVDTSKRAWRITPTSPLPALQKPDTRLDGARVVIVSGEKAGAEAIGLRIEAPRCRVEGMKWVNWSGEAILILNSRTQIKNNTFEDSPTGIGVQGQKSRSNRFASNTFEGVAKPIALEEGANDAIAAPSLTILRDDAIAPVSHKFMVAFKGKFKTNVTLELDYCSDEARGKPQIQSVRDTRTLKTDEQGNAVWQFDWKGYPAGSWTTTATQNGNTSEFSGVVVMPYL